MTNSTLRHAATLTVAVVLLTGCGGVQPVNGLQDAAASARKSRTSQGLLYAAAGNQIDVFPLTGRNLGQVNTITTGVDGAWGLYVDSTDTLYVANTGNNTVTAYPNGSTSPSATFSRDLDYPWYVVADGAGHVFVSNGGNGTVVEFTAGSSSPTEVLQTPGNWAAGLALDEQGNLYVAYGNGFGSFRSHIEKFSPGSTQGQTLGMNIRRPRGLFVDNSGNIIVLEVGSKDRNNVLVFPPGANAPSVDINLVDHPPVQVAMQSNERHIFLSKFKTRHSTLGIYEAAYPLTSTSKFHEYQMQCCGGIAVSNP